MSGKVIGNKCIARWKYLSLEAYKNLKFKYGLSLRSKVLQGTACLLNPIDSPDLTNSTVPIWSR